MILSHLFYPTVFLLPHELEHYVICPYVTCH